MAENTNDNFFKQLGKLFSTQAIVRVDKEGKRSVADTENRQAVSTNIHNLKDRYNRVQRSFYSDGMSAQSMAYHTVRRELFRDYDCIHGDTIIPLPDGSYPTIQELAERYANKPNERFYVFSFDHDTETIKLGNAFNPRYKGKQETYKVVFDNNNSIIATADHLFLTRNGEYVKLKDLKVGDSLMPFYRKDFYKKGYRHIYNFHKGWYREHNLIAEQFYRDVTEDEVVHHKDFNCKNNLPDNLHIMTKSEHRRDHAEVMNSKIWSPENRDAQVEAIRKAAKLRNNFSWNGRRVGENNPFHGKNHTSEHKQYMSNLMKVLKKEVDTNGEKNTNYRHNLTYDVIQTNSIALLKDNRLTKQNLTERLRCGASTIDSRLAAKKFDWLQFKNYIHSIVNHTIKDIEYVGYEDVYDLSVDTYHNFATNDIFIHNCMDSDAVISSALDIYADESTLRDEFGNVLKIKSQNEKVKELLENLFYDILNIDFNLWPWTRNMVKYGDFFLSIEIAPNLGIVNVQPLPIYETQRIENSDPDNPNYIKFKVDSDPNGKGDYENYEIVHFRLLSDTNFLPYGRSMIEGARRTWKQIMLMEDAMLIHRIMRAPEKRVFKIDIGNIPPTEVDNYMQKIINKMKKVPFVDTRTGDYNLKYNIQNVTEDFYLPVRGGDSGTSIENLGGLEYAAIDDIDYLKNKLFAALKIPKAYLGYEEGVCISPDTKIPLLSGEVKTASELITDYENGIQNYVYSINEETQDIVPGEVEWAGMTRMDAEVVKVWLDNEKYIICTPDHKFLKRDGEWINAIDLKENDYLMSFSELYIIESYKVSRVEILTERIDTCDIRVSKYHNFGTNAGVIIHNSGKATIAAEDVRFARTIERLQRVLESELTKLAVIHLASQGINQSEIVNFELSLTNPSTIYEQEKLNLWSEKVRLVADIQQLKMLSKNWAYQNIFNMSKEEIDTERVNVINDVKDTYRHNTIENEGEDPAEKKDPVDVEAELEELKSEAKDKGGRPREGGTYGKDKHPYGRDPLGDDENHKGIKQERPVRKQTNRIAREYVNGIASKKKVIAELKDFLDDSNLLEE
jgi:intein/homing endonuclease